MKVTPFALQHGSLSACALLPTMRSGDGQSALSDAVVLNAYDRTFIEKEAFKVWENAIEDGVHVLDSGRREPERND